MRTSALEAKLGVSFPDDYKDFLRTVGSLICEVDADIWPRPGVGSVGPHWMQTCYELDGYDVCGEAEWLRIDVNTEGFRSSARSRLVPVFMWINSRDCIAFNAEGKLVDYVGGEDDELDETFTEVLHRRLAEQRAYKEELRAGA